LLINAGGGTFTAVTDLPSSAAALHIRPVPDGILHVASIGNKYNNNQLLVNTGDSIFTQNTMDLSKNGALLTQSSEAIADMDNDGMLDIFIVNIDQKNKPIINACHSTLTM
jgi:hypothetical protein